AARPVEVGRGHVAVDADGHGERARPRARALLVEHGRSQEVGAGAAVLVVVLDAEQPQLAHARPDRARQAPGRLPLLDVRHDLLLDERPHRRPEHFMLLVEDFHAVAHFVLTASRSTAPSAVRGSGSGNATAWGGLKRAILVA